MMGLGLGAIVGGYLTDRIKHKLEFYLGIELLIGLFGCISIPFLEFLGRSTAGSNYLISFVYMFAFLCFPTFLMGITLPLLTKIFNKIINNFLGSLSYLYFINTLGAAVGSLFSSYLLISFFGLDISIYFAAAINLLIALLIFVFKNNFSKSDTTAAPLQAQSVHEVSTSSSFSTHRLIYLIVFVTGFIAMGYEIIWFRIIGTIVKASPYAFSSVLFIYLLGIALGSFLIKKYLSFNTTIDKKNLFFIFQFSIAVFVLFSIGAFYNLVGNCELFIKMNSFSFQNILHPLVKVPSFLSIGAFLKDLFLLFDVLIWPLIFVFVPTLLMGASFPLITSFAFNADKEGNTVGKVYFFNVLGNVTGGLLTGLFLLSFFGTERSIVFLSFLGILFLFFIKSESKLFRLSSKILLVSIVLVLTFAFFPKKHLLYSIIHPATYFSQHDTKIISEGLDGVNVTFSFEDNQMTYINGMTHGGRPNPGFCFEAIEALSHHKQVKNILIIGFGTGTLTETILHLSPKPRITLVELSKTLIENLRQIHSLDSMLNDESVDLLFADGRKFLYNNKDSFDAIFIDPLRTTTSFSNNLYSQQFFTLIKSHLTSDGIFMSWMDEYHVMPKTICSVFPFVKQYSYFCLASKNEFKQNSDFKYDLYTHFPSYHKALLYIDSINRFPISKSTILLKNKNYPINEDYRPRCEYYIGLKGIEQ